MIVTHTIGTLMHEQPPVVISEYSVARKTALSTPSASATVSPAKVLRTTLLIRFDCLEKVPKCSPEHSPFVLD